MSRRKILLYIAVAVVLLGAIAIGIVLLLSGKPVFYNVTFQDFDGAVLKTESVECGKSATAPADPEREGYQFVGWNKAFSAVVEDTIIIAEYCRNTDMVFKVDTVTATSDAKNVEIKVSVNNNPGILGMVFSVNYDESALKLVNCQNGVALSALVFQEPSNLNNGCKFIWYGSEIGGVMDGDMLILTFAVKEGVTPGSYPITVSWEDRNIYDSNCDMLNPEIIQGAIVVN